MKLSVITLLFFGPTLVSAARMVRFFFNSTQTCTVADSSKIDAIFNAVVPRRQLRVSSKNAHRELWAAYCKDNCAGYVSGQCRATNCNGYRRRAAEADNEGELQVSCADQIQLMNDKMNLLVTTDAVSESCKAYLDPSLRTAECYDDVIYGELENIRLWNMTTTTPTLITNNMLSGYTICKSLTFTIEAKVNPCVDFVNFTMVGPVGANYLREHTENVVPYALFDSTTNGTMLGKKLYNSGNYTLTIVPDGFKNKTKEIVFTVLKGC
jgi:hypothetical protein